MALRVLLADESASIKKVMQLALQEFGVEVKAVPIGIDVLQVARSFNPDIVFADILLAKRSGYDVCADVKNDPLLNKVPVVLMWSGFMDLDQTKFTQVKADRSLEKPFDAESLRSIVKDLVHRVNENKIIEYLNFPDLPVIEEDPIPLESELKLEPPPEKFEEIEHTEPHYQPAKEKLEIRLDKAASATKDISSFAKEDLTPVDMDDLDDFQQVPLPKSSPTPIQAVSNDGDDWNQSSLAQFKLNLPEDRFETFDPVEYTKGLGAAELIEEPTAVANSAVPAAALSEKDIQPALEAMIRKMLPDILEKVVREEIQKLMKEIESEL